MAQPRNALILVVLGLLLLPSRSLAVSGNWSLLPNSPLPGSAQRHDDLTFVDADHGWLVNGIGDIYSTSDGGATWHYQVDTNVYNRCVAFTDSLQGVVGLLYQSGSTALLRTTNGGATWNPVALPDPVPHGLCGLWAASDSVIYGVGAYYGYPTLARTADRGATWSTSDMSAYCGALVDCYFWHPDSGIAVGSTTPGSTRQPRILMTTDGGNTWTIQWTGSRTQELCWKISFVDRNTGFVSLENLSGSGSAYFLETKTGGLTWEEHLFSANYLNCQGIGFVDETTGWIGGWNFKTVATTDGGDTWIDAGFGYNINRFRFLSPTLGYACGDRVYKWVGTTSNVPGSGTASPLPPPPRLLAQNSPNPANRTTRISYRVEEGGPVTLELFDMKGRGIRTIYRGNRQPGTYAVTFDARDLPAGLYVYRLTTPSGRESRKMSVIP